MIDLSPAVPVMLYGASTVEAVGIVVAVIAVAGVVIYALANVRAGREEVGAELELAANLKPYYDDDELESRKLDRTLTFGLATLAVIGIGLPAYWLAEPGRMDGAEENFERVFADRGEETYNAQCSSCHGPDGVGGVASYTILDENSEFVAQADWKAPALDTVLLRYSRAEVTEILNYGRAFSPMPAWGEPGGGPLTEQQIKNLVDYLQSIQISSEESIAAVEGELANTLGAAGPSEIDYDSLETGKALFNLGEESGFAGGAYACARCHTRGWSINEGSVQPEGADVDRFIDYPDGAGALGPPLRGVIPRQFANTDLLAEFLMVGSEQGASYGNSGIGSGAMPGFGVNPNNDDIEDGIYPSEGGMLSDEMIHAIAEYVASLPAADIEDEV